MSADSQTATDSQQLPWRPAVEAIDAMFRGDLDTADDALVAALGQLRRYRAQCGGGDE